MGQNMNLLSNLPNELPEELASLLQEGTRVRIERISSAQVSGPLTAWGNAHSPLP
jgi:hypothetical protein